MLSCQRVAAEATEHLEGTLPLGRRLAFRLHLWICAACAAFVAQLAATRELLRGVGAKVSPEPRAGPSDELLAALAALDRAP